MSAADIEHSFRSEPHGQTPYNLPSTDASKCSHCTTVVIEKLDRLARDLMVQETAIADLRRNGFDLISAHEPDLMASDPTRILMRQMLGAFAQYDKSQIVAKLRGARMRRKAQTGRCEGRKPFGYYKGERASIARMKELRAAGLGFDRIAARLNAEQIPTRTGKPWHGFVVNGILGACSALSDSFEYSHLQG